MSLPVMRGPRTSGGLANLFSHINGVRVTSKRAFTYVNIFTSLHSFPEDTGTDKTGNAYDVPDLSIDLPWYTDSICDFLN